MPGVKNPGICIKSVSGLIDFAACFTSGFFSERAYLVEIFKVMEEKFSAGSMTTGLKT
jgi:hypothetical protein